MEIQGLLKDPKEIDKVCRNYFFSVDKNKNGVIIWGVRRILDKFAEDTDTIQESEENIRKAFDQLDTNHDGKISYEEFKICSKVTYLNILKKDKKSNIIYLYYIKY